jgi:small-conductance mechanosensitive channel
MPILPRIALLLFALLSPLYPQAPLYPQTADKSVDNKQTAYYDLVIQNRKVFTFRVSLGALEPGERLNLAKARLANMPANDLLGVVHCTQAPEGVLVSVGTHPLFSITPGDIDADICQTMESAVANVQSGLHAALEAEAAQRSLKKLIYGILKSLGALAVLVTALALLRRGARFVRRKITRLALSQLPKATHRHIRIFDPKRVSMWLGALLRLIYFAADAIAAYVCLIYVLNCFPYTQPWAGTLGGGLANLLLNMGMSVLHSIPGLFAVAVILFAARGLTYIVNNIFNAIERGETTMPWVYQDTAAPTRRIVVALLWIFAIIMAYPYIPGNDSIAFKGVSVFIGLLVSFGSAGIVNQAMNGLAIMYARTFRNGDFVKIGNVEGTVSELTMLSTRLRTIRHEEIVIPNSVVITQTTHNYTRLSSEHGVGISTAVGIGYDTPWRQVHELLMMAAANTSGLSGDPAPYVIQTALGNVCVEYTLVVHMKTEPKLRPFVRSELHQNILDIFNQHGVQILTPEYYTDSIPSVAPVDASLNMPLDSEQLR